MLLRPYLAVFLCFSPFWLAAAPETSAEERLLQNELKQQQIRTVARRVSDQLAGIVADFERNGISGEDVQVMVRIRGVLDRMSADQMERVITLLQQARATPDEGERTRQVSDAFAGQKGIILQLRELMEEYNRQQTLHQISTRLKALSDKQGQNMRLGVWLAGATQGRPLASFDESQKLNLRLQETEQDTLRAEVALELAKLDKLAQEVADGATAARTRAGLDQVRRGGLKQALDAAVQELAAARLLGAAGNEKRARDQLRELARLLIATDDAKEKLRQALRDLDRAFDEQTLVAKETLSIENNEQGVLTQTHQADVVDATDLVRRDLEAPAPVAADYLRQAIDRMQEAREVLGRDQSFQKQREQAPPKQQEALVRLQQARQEILEQLAKVEEFTEKPSDVLAELKDLRATLDELIRRQELMKEETGPATAQRRVELAPSQGELRDAAQQAQQAASASTPPVARSMGEAAQHMQLAQMALAAGEHGESAQQAAIEALVRAREQLADELTRMEQAGAQLAELEDLSKRLTEVIEKQQSMQLSTARLAARPDLPVPPQLSTQQGELAATAGQLREEAEATSPKAARPLQQARTHMTSAQEQLRQNQARGANPEQSEALAALQAARRALEEQQASLQSQTGAAPQAASDLDDIASRLQRAQKDVQAAMDEMNQGPPGLLETLSQRQEKLTQALQSLPAGASRPPGLNQATRAASQACTGLGQCDLSQAVQAMQNVEQAISESQRAGSGGSAGSKESLARLASEQAQVRKLAETLLAGQQKALPAAMQKASQLMEQASNTVGPITAGQLGSVPAAAQSALQAAQESLAQGTAQAAAQQVGPAQKEAGDASEALAQAQAALLLAQAGLGAGANLAAAGQGQSQGKGQGKGQGQGQGQGLGQGNDQQPGQSTPGPQGTGQSGNWGGQGGADGNRRGAAGSGAFTQLPSRDRAAIRQSQTEKYPQEYAPLVEQYLKNLSDQEGGK